jgi:hypothetical protein
VKERSRGERGREGNAGEDKLQEAWPDECSQTQVQAHAAGSASWRAEHEPRLASCADWAMGQIIIESRIKCAGRDSLPAGGRSANPTSWPGRTCRAGVWGARCAPGTLDRLLACRGPLAK